MRLVEWKSDGMKLIGVRKKINWMGSKLDMIIDRSSVGQELGGIEIRSTEICIRSSEENKLDGIEVRHKGNRIGVRLDRNWSSSVEQKLDILEFDGIEVKHDRN